MRVKDANVFVGNDLGRVINAAPGSKLLRQVIDVLRPHRSGVSGEAIGLEGHEIGKGLLAAELFKNGAGSKLVESVVAIGHQFILKDSRKGFDPGYLGIYRKADGEAFMVRYFPRYALNELAERMTKPYLSGSSTVRESLAQGIEQILNPDCADCVLGLLATNEPPTSIVLLDLNEILVRARERVEANRESLPAEFPVEKWLDAAVMASQVRDQVDSTEDVNEK